MSTQVVISTAGTSSWTVPAGVTSIQIEVIGGGQSGWIATTNNGGAGGDYSKKNALAVTPGDALNYQVGAGGASGTQTTALNGTDSWLKDAGGTIRALAQGGGSTTGNVGDTSHTGGAAGVGQGGGAGAGGPNGNGNSGVTASTTGGSGDAGSGGAGGTAATAGSAGTEFGSAGSGGGGGGSATTNGGSGGAAGGGGGGAKTGHNAGKGGTGLLVITYTASDTLTTTETLGGASSDARNWQSEQEALIQSPGGASVSGATTAGRTVGVTETLGGASSDSRVWQSEQEALIKPLAPATVAARVWQSEQEALVKTLAPATVSATTGHANPLSAADTLGGATGAAVVAPGPLLVEKAAAATAAALADIAAGGNPFYGRIFDLNGNTLWEGAFDGANPPGHETIQHDTGGPVASVSKTLTAMWAAENFTLGASDYPYFTHRSGYDLMGGNKCSNSNTLPLQTVGQCLLMTNPKTGLPYGTYDNPHLGIFSYDSCHEQWWLANIAGHSGDNRSDMARNYRTLFGTSLALQCSSPMPAGAVDCSADVLCTITLQLLNNTLSRYRALLEDPTWVPVNASNYFVDGSVWQSPAPTDGPWLHIWGMWVEPGGEYYWMAGSYGTVIWIKKDFSMAGIVFRIASQEGGDGGEMGTTSILTAQKIRDSFFAGAFLNTLTDTSSLGGATVAANEAQSESESLAKTLGGASVAATDVVGRKLATTETLGGATVAANEGQSESESLAETLGGAAAAAVVSKTASHAVNETLGGAKSAATAVVGHSDAATATLGGASSTGFLQSAPPVARVVAPPSGDITTFWDITNIRGDWQVANAALASGDDLTTAVLISLFTDRVANDDDVIPDGSTNRRGWWGDLGQDVPIGSRLWLISRSKLQPSVALQAKGYINEALAWLITDGVAASVNVTTSIVMPNRLNATVDILRVNGAQQSLNFNWAWNQLN